MDAMKRRIHIIAILLLCAACFAACAQAKDPVPRQLTLTEENFDYRRYADEHADIKEAYGYDRALLFQHLLNHGIMEGRSWHSTDPDVEAVIMGYDAEAKAVLIRSLVGDAMEENAGGTALILPEVTGAEALKEAEIDFARYAREYPEVAAICGEDEEALAAYFWEQGLREGHAVHSQNAKKEDILAGNDAIARAELLKLYRNPYVLGGAPNEWQREDFSGEEEERISSFYGKTLLTGDSIMQGYQRVCAAAQDPFLLSFQFLASHGYTLELALKEYGDGYHPVYRGERMPLWECVPLMESDTLICFLGEGDLSVGRTPEETAEMYERLLKKIAVVQPDLHIILMSMTYVYEGVERKILSSAKIAVTNERLYRMAKENDWGFIDVSYAMSDGHGNLTAEYSLDQQTHYVPDAYAVWTRVLKSYALREEKP
ncbi:MAG: hypothetical protein IJP92_04465 [Lachnospiraceae bacterium]|nr:hypothetical protein [Lachnospiraceae bacterium]